MIHPSEMTSPSIFCQTDRLRGLFATSPSLTTAKSQSESATSQAVANWRGFVVPAIALVLVSYFAIVQLSKWPGRLQYPGEEDAAEGTQLSEMVHLRTGIHIYRVPSGGEFDGAIYGPLCYLLGAAVINPNQPAYLPLRLLSLAATLGLATACGLFVFALTKRKRGAALATLLFLGNAFTGRYGVSARADMVALLLAFTGFLIFYRYRESRRALVISAAFMLLSFFYKQQFVGAPIAVFAYLVTTRRFRQAAEFVAVMVAGGLVLVGVFSFLIFPHQAFLLHFISYNHLPFDKSLVVPEILMFVVPLFVPLLGSADFVDRQEDKLVACYVVISAGAYFFLLYSSGSGADTNRCLEAVVVLSCGLAARIATAHGALPGLTWTGALAFTLALVTLLGSAFVVRQVRPEDFIADRTLQNYLRENFPAGTSALCYYAGDPLRAGLEAPVTNLWHYSSLIRKGALSDRDIVSRIDHGGYGVILLDFDVARFNSTKMADFYTTRSMRDAILRSYKQATRLDLPTPELTRYTDGNLYVWVPRSKNGPKGHN